MRHRDRPALPTAGPSHGPLPLTCRAAPTVPLYSHRVVRAPSPRYHFVGHVEEWGYHYA